MARNAELLTGWELYRQNAEIHRSGCGLPPCPICLCPMMRPGDEDVVGAIEPSRGHVVPAVAGEESRGAVPECKDCNSRFGAWYDMPFASQVITDQFRSKLLGPQELLKLLNRTGKWLNVNGALAEAEARDDGNGICLKANIDGPPPDLRSGVQLAVVDPPFPRVVVSLVHSAYLRLVWHLGYEYVFAPGVDSLRDDLHWAVQNRWNESELAKRFTRYGAPMLLHDRIDNWMELIILHEPASLASFVVPVPGIEGRAYTLFLPGFDEGLQGLYERFRAAVARQVQVRQFKWDVPREQRLSHPDARTWGGELWSEALGTPYVEDSGPSSAWRAWASTSTSHG